MVHKIDSPGHDNGAFTEGNPYTTPAVPATVIGSRWLNMVQNELEAVLSAASIALDKDDDTQLHAAIASLIDAAIDLNTGRAVTFTAATAYTTGELVQFGALFGYIKAAVSIGQTATLIQAGYGVATKVVGEVLAFGDRLYWDDTNKRVTTDSSGGKLEVGAAAAAATAGAAQVTLRIGPLGQIPTP